MQLQSKTVHNVLKRHIHEHRLNSFAGGHAESRNQRSIFYAAQRLSDKLHDEKDVSVQVASICRISNFKA